MAYGEYKQLEYAQRSELNRALYTANPLDKDALAIKRSQLINSAVTVINPPTGARVDLTHGPTVWIVARCRISNHNERNGTHP